MSACSQEPTFEPVFLVHNAVAIPGGLIEDIAEDHWYQVMGPEHVWLHQHDARRLCGDESSRPWRHRRYLWYCGQPDADLYVFVYMNLYLIVFGLNP